MRLFEINVSRPRLDLDRLQLAPSPAFGAPSGQALRPAPPKVPVRGELERRGALYYSAGYPRRAQCLGQIRMDTAAARAALQGMPEVRFVRSPDQDDLWYEQSDLWYDDGFLTSQSARFGMNACGRFVVEAYDARDVLIAQETVVVYPQTMTLEQYETMQAEVRELFRILDTRPAASENEREVRHPLFPLDAVERYTHALAGALDEIIDAPMEGLAFRQMSLAPERIKRWTSRTLIERERRKGQPKIRAEVTERHTDIPEHRMIRAMLETIAELVRQAETVESSRVTSLKLEEEERRTKLGARREEDGVAEALARRYARTRDELARFAGRTVRLSRLLALLDTFLETELFDVAPLDVEETHLFIHDARYGEVLELYALIRELLPELNPRKQAFVEQMANSPLLFEVWTLLQLCAELETLRFRTAGRSVTDLLLAHHDRHVTLSGVELTFFHPGTGDSVWLAYEREIILASGAKRKPDFLISYGHAETETRNIHVLDAKYKPYGTFPEDMLRKDFLRSAKRYVDDFETEGLPVRSATLIHSDVVSGAHHWNARIDGAPHAYAHFPVAPGQSGHLNTYIKRLLHHHNGRHGVCPACGELTTGMPKLKRNSDEAYKWTYICACDEVWVDNVCLHSRRLHPPALRNVRLLKYATGKHNWQDGNAWDVYCPVCDHSHGGDQYYPDLRGKRTEEHHAF